MKLLIIEDERQLADALAEILKKQKFSVDAVYDGEDGLSYGLTGLYDVIVLDIMLPKINGLEVLAEFRRKKISTPVLLLSARSETADKVGGLDLGADDYLTKPFSSAELIARLKALSRRKGEFAGDVMEFSDLLLDRDTFELSSRSGKIKLGAKEFYIMEILMKHGSKIMSKELIADKIWGYDSEAEYNAVEVYVSFLRKKLATIGSGVQIKSVRGIGYQLEGDKIAAND